MKLAQDRRTFLREASGLMALAAVGGLAATRPARAAAALDVPVVDRLAVSVLIDGSFDRFFRSAQLNGVSVQPPPRPADFRRVLHNEWGLSLWLESQRGDQARTFMLDYGYSPSVLHNNIELLGVDPGRLDALIVSHGHYDHFGGLLAFLDRYRDRLPANIKLYAGGEDNFCHRYSGTAGQLADYGLLDRRELTARKVMQVLADKPIVIAEQAFTTGRIERKGIERVLPNGLVEYGMKDGAGCDAGRYLGEAMNGKVVPDEHFHEHATCFNVRGKGLVVISSCGHVGIVNSVRQAQAVSGIEKVHAIVGGFHLGPAPADYLQQVVGEIRKLEPDVVIPMHCSGLNFVQEARAQMPDRLLVSTTGCRITFSA